MIVIHVLSNKHIFMMVAVFQKTFFISQNKRLKSVIAYRLYEYFDLICMRIGEHTELVNWGMQSFIGMLYCGKPLREPLPSKGIL